MFCFWCLEKYEVYLSGLPDTMDGTVLVALSDMYQREYLQRMDTTFYDTAPRGTAAL